MKSLTLLELLRRRSALTVEETWRLLDELPGLLDAAKRDGDLPGGNLLSALVVVFAMNAEGGAGASVGEWPVFRLSLLADATQSETAATFDPITDDSARDLPARFAALLYELLGGPHRSDGALPPLAGLDEAANRVLQRGLAGGAFADCAEFWREFLRASKGPPRVVRIPDSLLGSGAQGDVLKLTPRDDGMPIHLVARRQFRIGRSRADADLLTRFQPETPENARRTHELGRVQVFGEIIGGEPTLRDGNGTGPSANGSAFDGQPLAADVPMRLRRHGVLDLAGRFAFEVIPQFTTVEDFVIENLSAWNGASRLDFGSAARRTPLLGAVVFAARAGQPFARDAVWLFTRVDFAPGPDGGLAWLPPARNNPAAFLFRGGCFWIVNAGLPANAVQIGECVVAPGEAAPLTAGTSLRMGVREFQIEVG